MKTALFAGLVAASMLTVSAWAAPAAAQQRGPQTGSWEAIVGAAGSHDRKFHTGGFNLNGELGYYMTDDVMLSLRQQVTYAETDNSSRSILGTGVGADYHFDMGHGLRPFVGVTMSYLYGNGIRDTLAAGPEGGIKWYAKPDTFLFGRVNYEWAFRSSSQARHNFNDGRFLYTVGIGFNF